MKLVSLPLNIGLVQVIESKVKAKVEVKVDVECHRVKGKDPREMEVNVERCVCGGVWRICGVEICLLGDFRPMGSRSCAPSAEFLPLSQTPPSAVIHSGKSSWRV